MKIAALSLAACLVSGVASAQPTQPNATVAPPNTTSSQSHNPAVATTTNQNDTAAPAKGSNSFTQGQAAGRIAQRGYSNVSDLRKDENGVWRGAAQRNGQPVHVWLDYKGNVGQETQ
jgi:periplasmic protein CpxP/Spy